MEINQRKSKLIKIVLTVSIILNIVFCLDYLLSFLNLPQNRVGVLTKEASVGEFSGHSVLFKLPKGLTVRDASPQFLASAGQFEPNRFSITFTTDDETIVDYKIKKDSLNQFGELYSIDVNK